MLHVARRLGGLPPDHRPMGLLFEEPSGGRFPFEVGPLVARLRQVRRAGSGERVQGGGGGEFGGRIDAHRLRGYVGRFGCFVCVP